MDHEYIGFQGNKKQGYTLLISDGTTANYGGISEPVTRLIKSAELTPDSIQLLGSGKARFTRIHDDLDLSRIGDVQAKIKRASKELKSRSIKATIGALAIAGGSRVIGDIIVPGGGELTSRLAEKAIEACTWITETSSEAALYTAGTAGIGIVAEQAARVMRVYKFRLKVSGEEIFCEMPTHHFRNMVNSIQEVKNHEESE